MQLAKAVKSIFENAMSNWNKPIKFAQLQKLANQSMLRGIQVKEITKTSAIVFYES